MDPYTCPECQHRFFSIPRHQPPIIQMFSARDGLSAIPFSLTIINPKESRNLGCSSRCSARQGAYCRKSRGKSSAVKPCRFRRWRVRAISKMRLRSLANVTPVTFLDIGHLVQRRMFKLTGDLLSQWTTNSNLRCLAIILAGLHAFSSIYLYYIISNIIKQYCINHWHVTSWKI